MPAPTRRSVVRAGARAAWAAPLVSAAAAAPAVAASGSPATLRILAAQFWVRAVNGWYAVVPVVAFSNDLLTAVTGVRFQVPFATRDFTGLIADAGDPTVPPRPQAVSFGSTLPDWTRVYIRPTSGASQVTVYLGKKTPLSPGEIAAIGDATAWDFQFAWAFADDPTGVSSIPFLLLADGLAPVAGSMSRMDPPAH